MDNSFSRERFDTRQPSGLLASLPLFTSILNWLASLVQLTEEEQRQAGIYLGNQRDHTTYRAR
jgi:hypothetical protein